MSQMYNKFRYATLDADLRQCKIFFTKYVLYHIFVIHLHLKTYTNYLKEKKYEKGCNDACYSIFYGINRSMWR
jgi:hypothetical protein